MRYPNDDEEFHLREFLLRVWPDSEHDPHMQDTPMRMVKMYKDFFAPREIKSLTTFETKESEMVLLKDIPFYSLCAHHMLPFYGTAHVAYIPDKRIIGLSKIPRIINFFSHAPQVQEELTTDIANFLYVGIPDLHPRAVGVVLTATHFCMEMRGVEKAGVTTTTSALRGSFREDAAQRAEFLSLVS